MPSIDIGQVLLTVLMAIVIMQLRALLSKTGELEKKFDDVMKDVVALKEWKRSQERNQNRAA